MNTSMLSQTARIALFALSLLLGDNTLFAQSWDKSSPNILYGVDKSHDTTKVKVGIGTANPQAPLQVKGQIIVDSIRVSQIIPKDSIIKFGAGSDGIVMNNTTNVMFWTNGRLVRCSNHLLTPVQGFGLGNNGTMAIGQNSMAIGTSVFVPCSVTQAMVLGAGVSASNMLVNSISNSLMIGFNSTYPTLYVGPSLGGNSSGNVGIGTDAPITALHVATNGRTVGYITSDPLAPAGAGPLTATEGLVIANGVGTMISKLNFSGNANQVLLGNGTFGPVPGGGGGTSNAWIVTGNAVSTGNNFLGTTNAFDVVLISGGPQRGVIDHNTGFWGFGSAFTPAFLVDVNGGDIDASTSNTGYRIGGDYVL